MAQDCVECEDTKKEKTMVLHTDNYQRWLQQRSMVTRLLSLVLVLFCCTTVVAAEGPEQPAETPAPVTDRYSGDFLTRSTMTGDWGGVRNLMAAKGVTFDMRLTQTGQGVVDGGKSGSWQYGGRGQLTLSIDTGKLGLWPGGFLTIEGEGNFGRGVNGNTGALMPVNNNQIYPMPGRTEFYLPAWNFAQFLSEYFGIAVGKFDTTSGDDNEFAHSKGDTQFMNLAFGANPVAVFTVPYSTLGASVIILPTKDPKSALMQLSVLDAGGTADKAGFNHLNGNRLTFAGQARVRTDFFGYTGHQSIAVTYSNKEFTSIEQRVGDIISGDIENKKGSWSVFYNFDQYLYEPVKGSGRGLGVFGRFGAADGNPNPIKFFYSLGLGSSSRTTPRIRTASSRRSSSCGRPRARPTC
jgi:porin